MPGGVEATGHADTVQRDQALYGAGVERFNHERLLMSEKKSFEVEAAHFTFGMGPRVCIGKDIALM